MWDDGERTGMGGGGFDISGYGSPGTSTADNRKAGKGPSSIYPVTIKQILDSQDDTVTISGNNVTMMKVVGIVKRIEVTSTKIVYTVEDWTGAINGLQWLDTDEEVQSKVVEDVYCKMTGTKRIQDGRGCLFIYHIAPIEDLMEITNHFLQIAYIPLKSEQMNADQADAPMPYMKMQMSASYGGQEDNNLGSAYNNMNLTPQQMRVYRVLQQFTGESGIDSKGIQEMMPVKMPVREIENVLEYLVSEGHIYATIDDFHFRATDLVA